ncbi:unnamed protein product [Bursaphelenchus okinawaensis]|uniref:Rho-GAP domain-containing protein n=1 Tax=Bursaphelenchus okinawaensis TaxID=465554 RepID=A0A811K6F5_9BILA|nr:unnamed protein product [Bursaphelenchus okinawaensis]CAG9092386.1 unnamed protein product [Bursaphelenchus okinawaensis]
MDDFSEVEDGFADDDLLSPTEVAALKISDGRGDNSMQRSFLERDNFENELGIQADDPFGEDFSDIHQLEVVSVIAEGDFVSRPVIMIYAYRLPSNKTFNHDKFLRYLMKTLDRVVDLDYTIVYFHYGLRSHNKPPLKWLIQTYQMLDRRYKKNLKALYLVHPTRFIRIAWKIFQPFISFKFERKVHYVNYVYELKTDLRLSNLNIPQPILDHDDNLRSTQKQTASVSSSPVQPPRPTQQFDVSLEFILNHNRDCDIPPIVSELLEFLNENGLEVEGIFRRSAEITTIRNLQDRINKGEKIDFVNDPEYKGKMQKAVIDASVLLKTFFRSMGEPVITNGLYGELVKISSVEKEKKTEAIKEFVKKLPRENYVLLKTICKFLTKVAENCKVNLMDANNLSVVFGPNFTWPTDQHVPINQLHNLNNFCYKLITEYDQIFE